MLFHASRRQSRYLFYCIVMKMLRNVILLTPELQSPEVTASSLTTAILKLSDPTSCG